jgi:4-amino-4-deoxy-L-arabinose transferase-like glycosyltransferase
MSYHLSEVLIYQRAHGFPRITTDIYANLSEGIEMLYLFAFEFGKHSAASSGSLLVADRACVPGPCVWTAHRTARGGRGGAIFTYTCPVMLRDATTAYIDVALAAVLFALFYLLQVWDETRDPKLLAPIGILAGFGYAVKYTAFLAVPYALGFVAWKLWRAHKPLLRPVLVVALLAAVMILPWMLKNWIEVANPVVAARQSHLSESLCAHLVRRRVAALFQHLRICHSRWQIPLEVTLKGGQLGGFLGPLFLLTPLALLALRFREGRQLLLAGWCSGAPISATLERAF